MSEERRSFLWNVGLSVYIPDESDIQAVKDNEGFFPADQALIDQGFWTEEECLAYSIFQNTSKPAVERHDIFLRGYREGVAKRAELEKRSSIIVPKGKKIITP